jgi:hypothetical protein
MFPPRSRARFQTIRGEMLGTMECVHEHDVHSVRPDDGVYPILLLLARSLQSAEEADVPFVVQS